MMVVQLFRFTFPIIFVFVLLAVSSEMKPIKSDTSSSDVSNQSKDYRENYALFNCHKQRSCTPGGDKVCAINEETNQMTEFPDKCLFYRANCEWLGDFWIREGDTCNAVVVYDKIIRYVDHDVFATKSPEQPSTAKLKARARHNIVHKTLH